MVYFYCLEEVAGFDEQLTDVVMPANQVKMDSSVPWALVSMDSCKLEDESTRKKQGLQLQKLQDGRPIECSRLEAAPRCDDTDLLGSPAVTSSTAQLSAADLTLDKDLMTSEVKDLKSPEFDPFSLFDDDREQDKSFQEDLLALEKMLHFPDSDDAALFL
jgi:hypothetical protein